MTPQDEILPPALSKHEARPLLNAAKRHWRGAQRNALQFAAKLRQLQDAGVHHTYGYADFGEWAESEFEDLSRASAWMFSREGSIMLELQAAGRLSLGSRDKFPIGTTGVRALEKVRKGHAVDEMLAVYDRARRLHAHKVLSAADINAARRELLPAPRPVPAREGEHPAPEPPPEPYEPIPDEALTGAAAVDELRSLTLGVEELITEAIWSADNRPAAREAAGTLMQSLSKLLRLIG